MATGLGPLVREHESLMEALLKKLKCNGVRIRDPFSVVQKSRKHDDKYPIYDDETYWRLKKPKKYPNVDIFKECLTYCALENGFSLWFEWSTKNKVIATCGQRKETLKDPSKGKQRNYLKHPSDNTGKSQCLWRCYGKMLREESTFQVISLKDTHTCVRSFHYGRLVNYKWIARQFGDRIRMNPKITLNNIVELVLRKYKCTVSHSQCRNAKIYALIEKDATIQDHYGLLRSYAKALVDSNEGSIVKVGVTVNPAENTYFDRFYVCFNGLKEGWKLGCRRILALDGC